MTLARNAYVIVNAVMIPNCSSTGRMANASVPKPPTVVAALPGAPPVPVTVVSRADQTLPWRSSSRVYRELT